MFRITNQIIIFMDMIEDLDSLINNNHLIRLLDPKYEDVYKTTYEGLKNKQSDLLVNLSNSLTNLEISCGILHNGTKIILKPELKRTFLEEVEYLQSEISSLKNNLKQIQDKASNDVLIEQRKIIDAKESLLRKALSIKATLD